MPVWVLKVLHFFGLTNLSDADVERYALLKSGGADGAVVGRATGITVNQGILEIGNGEEVERQVRRVVRVADLRFIPGIGTCKATVRQ